MQIFHENFHVHMNIDSGQKYMPKDKFNSTGTGALLANMLQDLINIRAHMWLAQQI